MTHKVNEFGEVRLLLDMPDTVYNHLLCMADDAEMSVENYVIQMAVYGCVESDDRINNMLDNSRMI